MGIQESSESSIFALSQSNDGNVMGFMGLQRAYVFKFFNFSCRLASSRISASNFSACLLYIVLSLACMLGLEGVLVT